MMLVMLCMLPYVTSILLYERLSHYGLFMSWLNVIQFLLTVIFYQIL
jgi:hypothetical protein